MIVDYYMHWAIPNVRKSRLFLLDFLNPASIMHFIEVVMQEIFERRTQNEEAMRVNQDQCNQN